MVKELNGLPRLLLRSYWIRGGQVKVLVLGCGPAGLIAANAAVMAGADVKILSKPRKSFMKGAQYLHEPISGIDCGEPFHVTYELMGAPEAYRMKVYGRQWDGTVSPEDLAVSHPAWDIRRAYDDLFRLFGSYVEPWDAIPGSLVSILERAKPDLTVSTVPAQLLCTKGHQFRAAKVYSNDQAFVETDNTVLCNGKDMPRWYRTASIQGWHTTEWPDGEKPPFSNMFEVLKPLSTNCDCFPQVMRGGRYGKWAKGVLSHEIGQEVTEKCQAFQAGLW